MWDSMSDAELAEQRKRGFWQNGQFVILGSGVCGAGVQPERVRGIAVGTPFDSASRRVCNAHAPIPSPNVGNHGTSGARARAPLGTVDFIVGIRSYFSVEPVLVSSATVPAVLMG